MLTTLKNTKSRVSWTVGILIALAALAALTLPAVYLSSTSNVLADDAGPPATEYFLPPTDSEKKILELLEQPTQADFVEEPLQRVVDYFAQTHKVEIQLDYKALEDAAIGSDTPVTRRLKDLKLKSTLNLLLRDMDLTYLIKDEVLLITTKEKSESDLLTRTYPVGDLVEVTDGQANYDHFIDAITNTVRPTTWDEVGGPGSIEEMPISKSVVISQTREVHDEVLELLRALRAAKKASLQKSE